jgi:hypothetical protein
LKSIAVVRRFNDTEDFDIISEKKMHRVINYITQVIHEYVEKQRPQNRSLRNAREHYKKAMKEFQKHEPEIICWK